MRHCYRLLIIETTSENVLNGFHSPYAKKKLENAANTDYFGLVFERKSDGESFVFKIFPVRTRTQDGVFKFLEFKDVSASTQEGNDLLLPKRPKTLGVTDFVLERTCPEKYPKSFCSDFKGLHRHLKASIKSTEGR